jgi:hypothetical protein
MNKSFSNLGTSKSRYTQIFNRAFRRGANERAALGLAKSAKLQPPSSVPEPTLPLQGWDYDAWQKGFEVGFRIGASDAELAKSETPGAEGLISGFGEEFLEQCGFLPTTE